MVKWYFGLFVVDRSGLGGGGCSRSSCFVEVKEIGVVSSSSSSSSRYLSSLFFYV